MESTIERTLCHILLLVQHLNHYNLRGAIIVALMELGVPTKSAGFAFLKKAIEMKREDPTRAFAKDIYLEISLRYKQNSEEAVDQAIREAIRLAWEYGSKDAWEWYFSYNGRALSNRPSNGEFISRIAYILEIWQECKIARGDRYERE